MLSVDVDRVSTQLAIVIPTHRALYLHEALTSLANQTDQRFIVYIGDDASKDDIAAVCAAFAGRLELQHHRFEKNLGQIDLVSQWSRSVDLSSEPWVWMIGDDDQLEPGCVAAWYDAVEANPHVDLFHFAVRRIDAQGLVTLNEDAFAPMLTARQFLKGRMSFALASYAPDYVFSRAAFKRHGGFQSFPLAWCTDDATWVKLAAEKGICSVCGPRVRWRLSGSNISSRSAANAAAKAQAHIEYLEWLALRLPTFPQHTGDPSDVELRRLAAWWYFEQATRVGFRFWPLRAWELSRRLARVGLCPMWMGLVRAARADLRQIRRA